MYHGMGPGRHRDSLELQLTAISEAVSVAHFGLLVKKNRAVQKKIKSLERVKAACLKDAAETYKMGEAEFTKLAHDLRGRIIGTDGLAPDADGAGDALGDFSVLSIKTRLLKSEPFFYSRLFFGGLAKADGEVGALATRRALLEGQLVQSDALRAIGYSSQGVEWLASEGAKSAIAPAIKYEKSLLEDAIEQNITELDHRRAALQSRALESRELTKLKRECTTLRATVGKHLRTWTFWNEFDTTSGSSTLGRAKVGWEEAAAAHGAELLGKPEDVSDAGVSRSFPWDAPEATSSGHHVPRRTLLKFLDNIYELLRSYEEFSTLLPYDLRRAVRYYELYSGNIAAVLAKINAEIAAKRAVIGSQEPKEVKARAVADVSDLLFRREFLVRRRAYVDERQRQGAAAVANWFAKGKPLLAVMPALTDIEVTEGDDDSNGEGQFDALPLLAAGGAAHALMMLDPGEGGEEEDG